MFAGLLIIVGLAAYGLSSSSLMGGHQVIEQEAAQLSVEEEFSHVLSRGATLYTALRDLRVDPKAILEVVHAAKPHYDFRRVLPGMRFNLSYSRQPVRVLNAAKFYLSPVDVLIVTRKSDGWVSEKVTMEVETRVVSYWGTVTGTLWESAERAQMDPELITQLADIFAWRIDFAREVRVNDRWRISVEQKFVNQEAIGWGAIVAAEYENRGELHSAVLFRKGDKTLGYFSPDGSSLKRMFLKSPLKFGRISSRFQRKRFHPILKIHRPHFGVDYAAPRGTPIRAVGDGVLISAGWRGEGGNTIRIRHNSVYGTAYKHLSRIAKGMGAGVRVQQGQIIGYVGSTGMSTAPHLHFEFLKYGRHVDPLSEAFPSADPVPAELLAEFQQESILKLNLLPPWESKVTFTKSSSRSEATMVD